ESIRTNAAIANCDARAMASKVMGIPYTEKQKNDDYFAFLSGWEAAMEMGHGELLAENNALQSERFDLTFGQKRVIQLERLAEEITWIRVEHGDQCDCETCQAFERYLESLPKEED